MKVVFLSDVKGVAKRGETKDVSDGYYRNFLSPKAIAVPQTDPRAQKIMQELAAKKNNEAAEIEKLRQLAQRFNGQTVELKAKAQGSGKLFGAIRETEIADALKIDKKIIKMEPIKTGGSHGVTLQFSHGITARITVIVIPVA